MAHLGACPTGDQEVADLTPAGSAIYRNIDYGRCPKILYTKVPDKMAYANIVDPDQIVLEGAV